MATFRRSIDFPGGSELNCSAEGPLKGAKMTVIDIHEFRDINRPGPMPKFGVIMRNQDGGRVSHDVNNLLWYSFHIKVRTV